MATATWKWRCVSTPRITPPSVVCGLSAPIVFTSESPFDLALTSRPEGRHRTDDTVRGHAPGGGLLLGHDAAPASGGLRATPGRPADESLRRHLSGPRGRRVRPLRGIAHSHPSGYSQRGREILRSLFAGSWIRPLNTPVRCPRTGSERTSENDPSTHLGE